jgi:carbon monoxide dehydrogenase subunit G
MGKIERTVEFPAAPEHVWSVVSNLDDWDKWLSMHSKWKSEVPAELKEGAQVTAVVNLLNMPNTITWTVDEYAPPKSVRLSGTGMAGVKVAIGLEVTPSDAGSTMSLTAEFEGQMIVGAIGAAVEKAGNAELDASLEKLTALVV